MQKESKWMNIVWHGMPFLALAVWGALCISNQLWYDEAFSAGLVMQPWGKLIRITAVDDHSPFYYAVLKVFYQILQAGFGLASREVPLGACKLLSLLFMMGYMLLGKYYVARLFDRRISVYFMVLSLLSPLVCVQAGNVRMYAMALFFWTLTALLACDLYRAESRRKWILFVCASVCVVYCHTFAMIETVWLYVLFGAALLASRQYGKVKRFLISGAVVSVAFSPWLAVTVRQMQLRMRDDVGSVEKLAGPEEIRAYFLEWCSALETPVEAVMWVVLGVWLFLFGVALVRMRRTKEYTPVVGTAAFVLTALTGFLVSALWNNCFLGRYAFPGFGGLLLTGAVGLAELAQRAEQSADEDTELTQRPEQSADGDTVQSANRRTRQRADGQIARRALARNVVACGLLAVLACCFAVQYRLELQLEYDGGLAQYEAFWQEHVQEGDVWVAPHGHAVFLSVYHPAAHYYLNGYVPADLSFPNLEACYDIGRLVREHGGAWYITFAGSTPEDAEEGLCYEERARFHYMYYDFVIYHLSD